MKGSAGCLTIAVSVDMFCDGSAGRGVNTCMFMKQVSCGAVEQG